MAEGERHAGIRAAVGNLRRVEAPVLFGRVDPLLAKLVGVEGVVGHLRKVCAERVAVEVLNRVAEHHRRDDVQHCRAQINYQPRFDILLTKPCDVTRLVATHHLSHHAGEVDLDYVPVFVGHAHDGVEEVFRIASGCCCPAPCSVLLVTNTEALNQVAVDFDDALCRRCCGHYAQVTVGLGAVELSTVAFNPFVSLSAV